MSLPNMPEVHNFGAGDIVELDYLVREFKITRRAAGRYLRALHINPMYIGSKVFFSLPTMKAILFVLGLPGSPGFLFPGSAGKNCQRLLQDENYISEVTPDILARAAEPDIPALMAAAEGRNMDVIKKLITVPVGRPQKKEKKDESVWAMG